jgi:hypothetical protein
MTRGRISRHIKHFAGESHCRRGQPVEGADHHRPISRYGCRLPERRSRGAGHHNGPGRLRPTQHRYAGLSDDGQSGRRNTLGRLESQSAEGRGLGRGRRAGQEQNRRACHCVHKASDRPCVSVVDEQGPPGSSRCDPIAFRQFSMKVGGPPPGCNFMQARSGSGDRRRGKGRIRLEQAVAGLGSRPARVDHSEPHVPVVAECRVGVAGCDKREDRHAAV